jgi:hypothetical protein
MRMSVSHVLLFLALSAMPIRAQVPAPSIQCPVLARLPADLKDSASPEERLWFELRQCNGGAVTVYAYERHKRTPSLTVETGDAYPTFLGHTFNVLVLESPGGSANHVRVITFRDGKPSLELERSAGGPIQLQRQENSLTVKVPPKTYPGPDGKFHSVPDAAYTFALEY